MSGHKYIVGGGYRGGGYPGIVERGAYPEGERRRCGQKLTFFVPMVRKK